MIAVFDTSPLCFLVLIDEETLPPRLFDEIWIPSSVFDELDDPEAPDLVGKWLRDRPEWLQVADPAPEQFDELATLHPGERDAILLARQKEVDFVVIDERKGRAAARRLGLDVTGLVGLLGFASREGLVDLTDSFRRLQKTHSRVEPKILREVLEREGRRLSWPESTSSTPARTSSGRISRFRLRSPTPRASR